MRAVLEGVWYVGETLYSLVMLIFENPDDRDERDQRWRLESLRRRR